MRCVRRVRCVRGVVRAVHCVCAARCERADGAADAPGSADMIIALLLLLLLLLLLPVLRAVHVSALQLPCGLRADTKGACARLGWVPLTVPALLHAAFVSYQLNRLLPSILMSVCRSLLYFLRTDLLSGRGRARINPGDPSYIYTTNTLSQAFPPRGVES